MTLRIRFHPSVDPPPELIPFPASALREMLRAEGLADEGEVNCVLTSDAELAELNRRFRGRTRPTDVLAFPYDPADSGGVHGDVYVSIDRAREQAADRRDLAFREIGKQVHVKRPRRVTPAGGSGRIPDDVVSGVGRQGREHAFNVIAAFVAEVFVDLLIHLGGSEGGHVSRDWGCGD